MRFVAKFCLGLGLAFGLLFFVHPLLAQEANFPSKAIKIAVPYPPSVVPDVLARSLAEAVKKTIGQPVIVENYPGAGGALAAELVAKAPPDGYTLIIGDPGPMAIGPAIRNFAQYDPIRDFVPVVVMGTSNFYLAVRGSLGVSSVNEFIALAKSKPGLKYGSSGVGSIHHLMFASFARQAGIELTHVPYRSAAQYMPALYNEEIDVALSGIIVPGRKEAMDSGKMKIIGVTGSVRDFQEVSVPTIKEQGLPDMIFVADLTIYASAKTPPSILAKLRADFGTAAASPEVTKFLESINFQPGTLTGDKAAEEFRAQVARYKKIVDEIGIKPE